MPRKKDEYDTLDKLIMERINEGGRTFTFLFTGKVREEAYRLAKAGKVRGGDSSRILDRRLQALRKAGKIAHYSATGWRVL